MTQRYTQQYADAGGEMVLDLDGDWVKHDDHLFLEEQLTAALNALRLQELYSQLQREGSLNPTDPRLTEWIGEWDGYQSLESRHTSLSVLRRQSRYNILFQAGHLPHAP